MNLITVYYRARLGLRRAWVRFWMGPKLWWDRLWIREDEFHKSLSMDAVMYAEMDPIERRAYLNDLMTRREVAHRRDMARQDGRQDNVKG